MDEFRKQLDALMGSNRNGDKPQVQRHFDDPEVCKPYLLGCCPHDLFGNTKMDLGECPNLHAEPMKMEYEDARKTRSHFPFEMEVEKYLDSFVLECDKKIQKAQKRLEETQGVDIPKPPVPEQASGLGEIITEQINQLYKQAERLGEEGKVDESMELLKKAEELKEKRQAEQAAAERAGAGRGAVSAGAPGSVPAVPQGLLEALPAGLTNSMTQQQQQKLRVCDVCASLLSIYDSDRRLADHFGGKLHLGYMLLREKVAEMRSQRERPRERPRDDRRREDDRSRDRDRTDRDRDRERERERGDDRRRRSRSTSRERRDYRDRDRSGRDRDDKRSRRY
eukprot:TRINITY_DN30997_c0_g1_i1.p1 TRINITY_DN30997_c0_g1~~TRINITY_DN30997_c0_g1_i1.p1  ORF type:complete len:356 (+),score=0.69 TRINITY_DN30997_c0_g1_i1:58-1068(+)